jgi:hypothetical protein
MIDERATPPHRQIDPTPAPRELAAWIELVGCADELERMFEGLEAVRDGLMFSPAVKGGREARSARAAELDTLLGCLADHLRPAREVVRRFEDDFFPGESAETIAAWARRLRKNQASGHGRVRGFLADARGDTLPALRHLLACPLCERLARLLLFGFLPGTVDRPARRRRRRRRKPSNDSQPARGEGG